MQQHTGIGAVPGRREGGTALAVTWKGSGVTRINFPGPRKDRRGRHGAGRRQVPGLAGRGASGGFGLDSGWIEVDLGCFGWISGGLGSGARPGPPIPVVPGCPCGSRKATSPPLPVCRGGKCAAVVEGIQDSGRSCRVWVSRRCTDASTGFKAQLPY